MVLAGIETIKWKPDSTPFPEDVSFLFVTSAIGKIRGLAESELKAPFLAWSPSAPTHEPNQ